jgi:hypothetical protein
MNSLWKASQDQRTFVAAASELAHHHQNGTILDPWEVPLGSTDLREVFRGAEPLGELMGWEIEREVNGRKVRLVILKA